MDIGTAPRANGMRVEVEETLQGHAFRVDNPNAPPPVQQLSPIELKQRLEAGAALHLFDVRSPPERERCRIDPSRLLDEAATAEIVALPRDAALVFYCHTGGRSQSAAEHFGCKASPTSPTSKGASTRGRIRSTRPSRSTELASALVFSAWQVAAGAIGV